MLVHEKKAFYKFFFTYFGSVALLILASGYFYFAQQKAQLIAQEHLSIIEYARQLKSGQHPSSKDITHEIKSASIKYFSMNNFQNSEDYFLKYVPYEWNSGYYLLKKSKNNYHKNVSILRNNIIAFQILLLALFGFISYFLSLQALKPMQEALLKLDNFSKDLIHDINTPITSILLNMKILHRDDSLKENKALSRIKQSVEDIYELHNNLMLLLQEKSLSMQKMDIEPIVDEVVETHQKLYPEAKFTVHLSKYETALNEKAFKQILTNIISNACKYSNDKIYITITLDKNRLLIQDKGIGIQNTEAIFERNYKENITGHGIGLDICKRLCDAMSITIELTSKINEGSYFYLYFKSNGIQK